MSANSPRSKRVASRQEVACEQRKREEHRTNSPRLGPSSEGDALLQRLAGKRDYYVRVYAHVARLSGPERKPVRVTFGSASVASRCRRIPGRFILDRIIRDGLLVCHERDAGSVTVSPADLANPTKE